LVASFLYFTKKEGNEFFIFGKTASGLLKVPILSDSI